MAARKKTIEEKLWPPSELLSPQDESRSKLQTRIQEGLDLKQIKINSLEELKTVSKKYYKWDSFNTELLKRLFSTEELAEEYSKHFGFASGYMNDPPLTEKINNLHSDIEDKIHRIDSIMERLELIPLSSKASSVVSTTETSLPNRIKTNKVFIVHGHDETAKANLEVFLHDIGLETVVLHRQADEGLTIIEKFEKHSDVGYAFILLTPDEIAYLKAEEDKSEEDRQKEFRARPNVIFEFGYFVGKLSRSRVCCLYTGDVTLPSDVHGMIYKKFTSSIEEVGIGIIKELKVAGYEISI